MNDTICSKCARACDTITPATSWEQARLDCIKGMLACPEGCGEKFIRANPEYVKRDDDGEVVWLRDS